MSTATVIRGREDHVPEGGRADCGLIIGRQSRAVRGPRSSVRSGRGNGRRRSWRKCVVDGRQWLVVTGVDGAAAGDQWMTVVHRV